MKGLVGLAVLLGVVAVVLSVIEMMDEGGPGEFKEETLSLQGDEAEQVEFEVEGIQGSHPFGTRGFMAHRTITGDDEGEQTMTCTPRIGDMVECEGAFVLSNGEIEILGTEPAADDGNAVSAIVGGTGDYKGAVGEVTIDWETPSFELDYVLPDED